MGPHYATRLQAGPGVERGKMNGVLHFDTEIAFVDPSRIGRPSRTEAAEEAPLNGIDLFTRKEGLLCPNSELPATTHYRKNLRTIPRDAALAHVVNHPAIMSAKN